MTVMCDYTGCEQPASASCKCAPDCRPFHFCLPHAVQHAEETGHAPRGWTDPEPKRTTCLAQYLCHWSDSVKFLSARAKPCQHKPGGGYFSVISARDFGLASYDGRLAVIFRVEPPTVGDVVHVHVCEDVEPRKKCVTPGRHVMWANADGSAPAGSVLVDGETTERVSRYLSIVPAGGHRATCKHSLYYSEAGGKTTLKGLGRQWSGEITLHNSTLWSFGFSGSCRSGRIYATAALYVASEPAECCGRLFAAHSLAGAGGLSDFHERSETRQGPRGSPRGGSPAVPLKWGPCYCREPSDYGAWAAYNGSRQSIEPTSIRSKFSDQRSGRASQLRTNLPPRSAQER